MTEVIQTPDQHHYLTKLLGYDYVIVYKPRGQIAELMVYLRKTPGNYQLLILSIPTYEFLHQLSLEYSSSLDL